MQKSKKVYHNTRKDITSTNIAVDDTIKTMRENDIYETHNAI